MFTFPTSMFGVGSSAPPPSNSLLDKTVAYFTFDNTTSSLISPDSTGDYRFYFQYDSANYDTGLVGSCVQPNLNGSSSVQMYIQTAAGGEVETDINFDLPTSGFISIAMWIYPTNFYGTDPLRILGNLLDYELTFDFISGSRYPTLVVSDDTPTEYRLPHTTSVSADDIWLLIGIEVNKVSGEYKIRFNNETPVVGTGIYTSQGTNGSRPQFTSDSSDSFGGYKVDRLHVCNSPLTDPEWDYLYDSGSGTTEYPFSSFV
jgi:hypothetical protein